MKKKVLATLLSTAMVASALIGCGGGRMLLPVTVL
mgnify:CR=1 FL=1